MAMETLKEISTKHAKKQPQMVNDLTEEAPILDVVKWKEASHNSHNVAEKVTDITGAAFVNFNAPLPVVGVSSGLEKVDLRVMGGDMEVAKDTADTMGGPAKYFADKQPLILRKAGNDTEKVLYYENWMAYAKFNANVIKAGATTGMVNSIVVCRFDEAGNVGLYDPTGFDQGTLLRVTLNGGGTLVKLSNPPLVGVNGYACELRGRFGYQMLNKNTLSAVVNINSTNKLTAMMLDDAIARARGRSGSTYIFCNPQVASYYISPIKTAQLAISLNERKMDTMVDSWNGIPIITSYNLLFDAETVTP